jgi:hypothetical protein
MHFKKKRLLPHLAKAPLLIALLSASAPPTMSFQQLIPFQEMVLSH